MSRSFDQLWMKRAKSLTQALIISGTMNIGLLGTFVYFVLKEKQASVSFEVPAIDRSAVIHETNEEVLRTYSMLSYQDLMLLLENQDRIEEGFCRRDLALACLVAFHHFNIEKALGGMTPQKRRIFFRNSDATEALDVIVYPALAEDQFDGILSYAKTERWPFTSRGLFFELKRSGREVDASLLDAFYTTPEFFSVYTFFQKVGLQVEKSTVVAFLTEGLWEPIAQFCEEQRMLQDFSDEKRRAFLLSYFEKYSSKLSAAMLSMLDLEYVGKRLDDTSILQFMDLIADKKNLLQRLAKEILISPRSDHVRMAAAHILYSSEGQSLPEPYDYIAAVERFCPEAIKKAPEATQKAIAQAKPALEGVATHLAKESKPGAPLKGLRHTIEAGDSLWKISRKYKVSIEDLKKINNLETEKLKVGKQLQIPVPKS